VTGRGCVKNSGQVGWGFVNEILLIHSDQEGLMNHSMQTLSGMTAGRFIAGDHAV
jgi:hypothetical protein